MSEDRLGAVLDFIASGAGNSMRERGEIEHKRRDKSFNLLQKYRLTIEDVESMEVSQGGACYICGKKTRLNVDHCHRTGRVRKLLCAHCNTGLSFLENEPLFARMQTYLRDHAFADVPALPKPLRKLQREFKKKVA